MPGIGFVHRGAWDRARERQCTGRRNDAASSRNRHERGHPDAFRIDRRARDPPAQVRRVVASVPTLQSFAGDRSGQRHPVVQPVLQGDKQPRALAIWIEM
ncbi:MAG TPA: hypothetical protein VJY39_03195 [Acidisphaera sp.]|nr:hypothetical protein [Acidisphaera sp.]